MIKVSHADEFRRCLIELDVIGICELWFYVAPGMSQPKNNHEALITLHHARTQAESIPERLRCYSHSWLLERSLPSGLPDRLKRKAERLYPHKVEAVGISVQSMSIDGAERAKAIEQAMSNAVAECYADGVTDTATIKARMAHARSRF